MSWKEKIALLPAGYSEAWYKGRRYGINRSDFNNGKSLKVYAEELGGTHFISFNYYVTSVSDLLKPCEMPEQDVVHFLEFCELIENDNKNNEPNKKQ